MAYLELCPGRDVRVTTGPEWDGDVTVEVYDKDEQSMPTCAIVLTSDEAIELGRKIIAHAISTQIHPREKYDRRQPTLSRVIG